jgi:hypothetical protein
MLIAEIKFSLAIKSIVSLDMKPFDMNKWNKSTFGYFFLHSKIVSLAYSKNIVGSE